MPILLRLSVLAAAVLVALVLRADEPRKPAPKRPSCILLIRHAEKPPDEEDSVHLSRTGKVRAAALHLLFEGTKRSPAMFPKPDFLFAARSSRNSNRSVETLTPLARHLDLKIDDSYRSPPSSGLKSDEKGISELAREILGNDRYHGKTVLICWHHGTMYDLARALGARPEDGYRGRDFDRVWRITFNAKGQARFADQPQRLLPGDSRR